MAVISLLACVIAVFAVALHLAKKDCCFVFGSLKSRSLTLCRMVKTLESTVGSRNLLKNFEFLLVPTQDHRRKLQETQEKNHIQFLGKTHRFPASFPSFGVLNI